MFKPVIHFERKRSFVVPTDEVSASDMENDLGAILDMVQGVLDGDPIALAPTPINPLAVHVVDSINIADTDWYRHDVDSISACLQSLLPGSLDEQPPNPLPNIAWSTTVGMGKLNFESNKNTNQKSNFAYKAKATNKTMKAYKRDSRFQSPGNTSAASQHHQSNRFRPYQSEQWSTRYQDLVEFRKQRGHCLVPHKWKQNPELAQWVKRQRYQYKLKIQGRHSTLTDERLSLLNKMGFVWDSHRAVWQERLNELVAFRAMHGHCNVHSGDGKYPQLSVWVKCQRRQYRLFNDEDPEERMKSTMTRDRIDQLNQIGFVWRPRNNSGSHRLDGDCPIGNTGIHLIGV